MKKLFTWAALLACATLGVASAAAKPPASATQAGQTSLTMSGKLTENQGKFFLTDETSRSTVEVRGEGLRTHIGHQVNVTGQVVPGATGAPEILVVSEVSRRAAGAILTGKAAGAAVKTGISKAVIVGGAAGGTAATVGSLYAADVLGSSETPVSR